MSTANDKCPKCGCVLEVGIRLTAAPPMQSSQAAAPATDASDIAELLSQINAGALNDWEAKFVADIRERFEKYGAARIKVSEKQMAALRKIALGDDL